MIPFLNFVLVYVVCVCAMCGDDFICSMECGLLVYLYLGGIRRCVEGKLL